MSELRTEKLHVELLDGIGEDGPVMPRRYTLTHSDRTGDLFLSIGPDYNHPQISGLYTRLMRDEVLAEWVLDGNDVQLIIHCHVSGGFAFGPASWRMSIFRQHLPMVITAFKFGDSDLFAAYQELNKSRVSIHFHSVQDRYNIVEDWGSIDNF